MTETPSAGPARIEPETKDWTFVIRDGCAECGFVPQDPARTGALLRATIPAWCAVLAGPDASSRPAPTVWSPVEYAGHVRDTCRIFRGRLTLMLSADDPTFPDWDQDAAAVAGDYFHADPAEVLPQLQGEASAVADAFDAVRTQEWQRPGRRSNGSGFTVATLAVYLLHDVVHHVHDCVR